MKASFWQERWKEKRIAFHEAGGNALIAAHFGTLGLSPGARVFVPLCGKSRDIAWLLSQGFSVVGVELSVIAVEELFEELGVSPSRRQVGPFEHFSAQDLDIFVGDAFALTSEIVGAVDAVCDRAAVVALPSDMRQNYAPHVAEITGHVPQLVISYEYDQNLMDGPPFSVDTDEMTRLYGQAFSMDLVLRQSVEGGLREAKDVTEAVWHLRAL